MRHILTDERQRIINFKRDLSADLRQGKIGIDDAIIKMFVFYSHNNVEEPPFFALKMAEAAVNSPYEAKAEFLRRLQIL